MARRKSSRKRGVLSEINVTPIVDVMLVLLIVFMVAAPLMVAGVPIDLPETEAGALQEDVEPLTISIRASGDTFIQDEAILADDLVDKLTAILGEKSDTRIYVRADGTADYERVADVMARLQQAGFNQIGLVTKPMQD